MSDEGQIQRAAAETIAPLRRRVRSPLPLATAGAGMLLRPLSVRPAEVVFVKGLVEASDGLCAVFAERGGELVLAAPQGRAAELDELLADLEVDLGAKLGGACRQVGGA